jgi:hypothetical protein
MAFDELIARIHLLEKQVNFLLPFYARYQCQCALVIQRWWRAVLRKRERRNPLVLNDQLEPILPLTPRQVPKFIEEVVIDMSDIEQDEFSSSRSSSNDSALEYV